MELNSIRLTVLGGGQSIGKSCFLLSISNQHILLDCGSYVVKDTKKALPDFSKLPKHVKVDDITAVLISHFHMDHVGGLLYLTDHLNYKGRIFASGPTRAILPLVLVNNRALISSQSQSQSNITVEKCTNLTKSICEVAIREVVEINPHLRITPHVAGHVLGAVMWEIEVDGKRVLYTGDFSGDEGGFIPSYQIPRTLQHLDMLIMECTYGNTDFKCLEDRRTSLIQTVVATIREGGKVLIPCYGIGFTQELIAILQQAWKEHGLTAPIYYASQDTKSTLPLFSVFSLWTSQSLSIHPEKLQGFHLDYVHSHDPFLLLAPHPNMITGVSKTVFPQIAGDERNLVLFLGNCPPDSFAGTILKENARVGENNTVPVRCKRKVIPFSAHPDRQCNCKLIEALKPSCVVLVHGDKQNCTGFMKYYIKKHSNPPLFFLPENGKTISFCPEITPVYLSERDEWEMSKRMRLNEEIIGKVEGRVLEVQKDGVFAKLQMSTIIPMNEDDWKMASTNSALHCEFIKGRGLKVSWDENSKDEAIRFISQFLTYYVCFILHWIDY